VRGPLFSATMNRLLLLLLFATTASAETFTFTVVGMDCAACGPPIVKTLEAIDGVKNAKVDWKSQTATVELPPSFDKQKIRTALTNAGFESVFPGEQRKEIEALPDEIVKTLDIVEYKDGRRADVASLMAIRQDHDRRLLRRMVRAVPRARDAVAAPDARKEAISRCAASTSASGTTSREAGHA
jgi:copper chaperone CopZ